MEKIASGEISVMVGTRSAIFSPVTRIGTIIIDSEESEYHKQEEPNPRYQVKDIAIQISQKTGCNVALLSSCPSLHALHEVRNKAYGYEELDQPEILVTPEIVDMGNEYSGGNFSPISYPLDHAIEHSLEHKKPVFLFLNRKGISGAFMCSDCGHLFRCGKCSLPYTYHDSGQLKCHHCSVSVAMPATCPKCRSMRLKPRGTGTEKLEDVIRSRFPVAKVLKLDQDTPLEHDASALASVADIIIGTVYALPYLPVKRLGLVGVISADTLFHLPDFRSSERTFGLLTRLHTLAAEARAAYIVQTHMPQTALFDAIRHHSIREFYLTELADRELLGYPPFTRLLRVLIQHPEEASGKQTAQSLYKELLAAAPADSHVAPPAPLHVFRLRDHYRWQIIIKLPVSAPLPTDALIQAANSAIIDVDPETLL